MVWNWYIGKRNRDVLNILKQLTNTELVNEETGIVAKISKTQRDKLVSMAAVRKSKDNGFSIIEHNQAVSIIVKLFKHATLIANDNDRRDDANIKSIKRFASPVILDKEPSIAYITVKESIEAGHRVYSLELFEIEKFGGKIQRLIEDKHSVAPNSIFSLNKKIDDVNNCSKVVDENGEPLIVL